MTQIRADVYNFRALPDTCISQPIGKNTKKLSEPLYQTENAVSANWDYLKLKFVLGYI